MNEWVTEVIKDYMNEAKEKEICIQLQIDPNIEEVWFDKQKCQTVLSNLLMNALKFSKANSNITVSTQRLENTVRISVIDEGSGIEDSIWQISSLNSTKVITKREEVDSDYIMPKQ